jgi:hypothetical protein
MGDERNVSYYTVQLTRRLDYGMKWTGCTYSDDHSDDEFGWRTITHLINTRPLRGRPVDKLSWLSVGTVVLKYAGPRNQTLFSGLSDRSTIASLRGETSSSPLQ